MTERQRFEQWCERMGLPVYRTVNFKDYKDSGTAWAWAGWRARAEVERRRK